MRLHDVCELTAPTRARHGLHVPHAPSKPGLEDPMLTAIHALQDCHFHQADALNMQQDTYMQQCVQQCSAVLVLHALQRQALQQGLTGNNVIAACLQVPAASLDTANARSLRCSTPPRPSDTVHHNLRIFARAGCSSGYWRLNVKSWTSPADWSAQAASRRAVH